MSRYELEKMVKNEMFDRHDGSSMCSQKTRSVTTLILKRDGEDIWRKRLLTDEVDIDHRLEEFEALVRALNRD